MKADTKKERNRDHGMCAGGSAFGVWGCSMEVWKQNLCCTGKSGGLLREWKNDAGI